MIMDKAGSNIYRSFLGPRYFVTISVQGDRTEFRKSQLAAILPDNWRRSDD